MFLAFVGPLLNHSGDIVKAVSELVASSRAGSRWAFGSSKIMHFHRLCLFYQGKNPMVQLNTKCCCKSVTSLLFIEYRACNLTFLRYAQITVFNEVTNGHISCF